MCDITHAQCTRFARLLRGWVAESCHTFEWIMLHVCVTLQMFVYLQCSRVWLWRRWVAESCHVFERFMSRIWDMSPIRMSHVAHMNESCRTYEWVMSPIRMSHVAHMNESCRTYETCRRYEWVMSHICSRFARLLRGWVYCERRRVLQCVLQCCCSAVAVYVAACWVMSHK